MQKPKPLMGFKIKVWPLVVEPRNNFTVAGYDLVAAGWE